MPFSELVADSKIGLVRSSSELGDNLPIPYLRMDAIQRNGQLKLSGLKKTIASEKERITYNLLAGDFLFNTRNSRELVGKTAVVPSNLDAVFNNNILRIRFEPSVNPYFIHAYFATHFAQNELEIRKSGTTSVFAVYQKSLESFPVPKPPKNLQFEFGQKTKAIMIQRDLLYRSFDVANTLFSSLQHRAFRGEL